MKEKFHSVIGIDLGTSYSRVAVYSRLSEQAEIINDPDNLPTTPSVVSLDPQSSRVIVGNLAKRNMAFDPQNTIVEIKREMGETFSESTLDKYGARGQKRARTEQEGAAAEESEGDPVQVRLANEWFYPQEISAFILMKMKEIAEKEIGEEVRDAVITVPANFTEKQKKATKEAALLAGLYPRQLIPEPTAAAICHGLDSYESEPKIYLVYDLGGGTFDVSIIRVVEERIEVIATSGNPRLGGGDFDDAITNWALEEIRRQTGADFSTHPTARARLKLHAEQTKILLSSYQSAKLPLGGVLDPRLNGPPSLELTQEKFGELIGTYLIDSLIYVDIAIKEAEKKGVRREDIDSILLVGGSSKIPLVRTILLDSFQKDESFVRSELDPDAVVARGAAKLALKFAPNPPPFEISRPDDSGLVNREAAEELDIHLITEHSLGLAVQHNHFLEIIPKGTSLPAEATVTNITNAGPGEHIEVRVYQGEEQFCHENTFIGMVYLGPMEPKPQGHHRFEVTFKLDVNGLLTAVVNHMNENKTYQARFEHKTGIGGFEALANMRKKLLSYYQTGFMPGVPHGVPRTETDSSGTSFRPPPTASPPPPEAGTSPVTPPPPSASSSVALAEAQVEIPEQYKPLVRRVEKLLLKQFNDHLAKSLNDFVTTLNEGGSPEDLEDVAFDLENDYHEIRTTPNTARASPKIDENVQFTVFRPKSVAPEIWYDLLAFAHHSERQPDALPWEPNPIQEVKRQAMQVLAEKYTNYQDLVQDSTQAIPQEGELTFLPEIPGFDFNPPRRTFFWQESVHREEFRLRASKLLSGQIARGRMSVFLGSILVSEIPLSIRVDSREAARTPEPPIESNSAPTFRYIFASYSRRDQSIVEEFEKYAQGLGDRYLRDLIDIRAGEEWSHRLLEMIHQANIFQLFWSHNSMTSPFVADEWRYALSLNRTRFVRPVYWEDPLPELPDQNLPPEELKRLHFVRVFPKIPDSSHSFIRKPSSHSSSTPSISQNSEKNKHLKKNYLSPEGVGELRKELRMPRLNSRDDAGLQRLSGEESYSLRGLIEEAPLPQVSKAGAEDFMSQLDRLVNKAKEKQYSQASALKFEEVPQEVGLADEKTLAAESLVERLFREARELISAEKFREALTPLAGVLAEVPGHPEALFLTAYCHFHLEEDLPALRALNPLRSARLDRHLANRVESLRADIRQRLLFQLLIETMLLMISKEHQDAINRLQEIVELAPEEGLFHFLLAGVLMTANRFKEALEAVDYGIHVGASEDRGLLEPLKGQIQQSYCAREMKPAQALFKQGEYRKARTFLHGLNPEYRKLPLYATFDGYLSRLGGGMLGWLRTPDPKSVQPPGSIADKEALYFFLVGEEIRRAKEFLEKDNTGQALKMAKQAVGYCPHFPYANFHYGGCLFRWVAERMASNNRPDLTEVAAILEQARTSLWIATEDSEIEEIAFDLLKKIREISEAIQGVREEAAQVNPLITEFGEIMKSAEGGIRSATHFREVSNRLRAIKAKLPKVAKHVQSPNAREILTQLAEAVDRNLDQLQTIETDIQDSEAVQRRVGRFNDIMSSIPNLQITSYQQLNRLRQDFQTLRDEVQADLRRVRSDEARKTLNQLLEAINRHLQGLAN